MQYPKFCICIQRCMDGNIDCFHHILFDVYAQKMSCLSWALFLCKCLFYAHLDVSTQCFFLCNMPCFAYVYTKMHGWKHRLPPSYFVWCLYAQKMICLPHMLAFPHSIFLMQYPKFHIKMHAWKHSDNSLLQWMSASY